MSTSVLKRALELFKEGEEKSGKGNAKKLKKNRKLKRSIEAKKSSNPTWQTAADIRGRLLSNDRTDDNLRTLKLLASSSLDEDVASKIMVRAGCKKLEETAVVIEDKTAFTEEDFEKFEKEYFLSG
ncbi:active regulator of SIRT1 isoform X2 [Hetaerina americana]|uniref:active regulator of SIRT1 isoform X2 n=1 Tax=Hetaerina americana TaxID=62018 RepID=UPI003A7F4D9E